jgi:hypothetical protein
VLKYPVLWIGIVRVDANPDPTFHVNADPDPIWMRIRIHSRQALDPNPAR